ncbi:unnamed protein product [Adineta steineri]|uniref:Non-specific protein-tyrosine kinase n=1 Tax=Adineta steineri TaxID=433720 RepID=A0A813RHX4_9BILA|nr:unnamed protein product [Adineta steineri]CAF1072269.1 unnamed protein product [Adineta steineri]
MAGQYSNCLVCPITFALFHDPVVAEDGHTYERSAIIDWIQRNGTSPLTRESITIAGLRPNHIVKTLVNEFRENLSKHDYKFKLGVDIERCQNPFFQTTGKALFEAKWIGNPNGPPIVLLKLYGARAEKEASFYENLTRHPHIVYTYGLVQASSTMNNSETFVMLLQEMAPKGSLFNYLEHHAETNPNRSLSDILLKEIFVQITDAMIFLSSKNIIHGDLACRNVLVFRLDDEEPKKALVKLTDFGISRGNCMYSKIDAVNTAIDIVPIRSSPPEVLANIDDDDDTVDVFTEKLDMYAMGVLMWEAYSNGKLPWGQYKNESVIRKKVISGERLSRPNFCKSDYQWELILKCMSQKPDDRPTFLELKTQLNESNPTLINSSITNSPSPIIHPTTVVAVIQEQKKVEQRPQSIIDTIETHKLDSPDHTETYKLDSPSYNETERASFPVIVGNVKLRKSFFEQKIEEQQRSSTVDQSRISLGPKSSIVRTASIKSTRPPEELIKVGFILV